MLNNLNAKVFPGFYIFNELWDGVFNDLIKRYAVAFFIVLQIYIKYSLAIENFKKVRKIIAK